ncbi:MAG: hypothetical protein GY796_33270 [Chloroflexi bacterium]|nr:hypothetical protein [Chloroflexota bacterium]
MSVIIETITPPESGPFNLELKLATDIAVTAVEARRKVSVYTGSYIADLLAGGRLSLVWRGNIAYWRVPVILSSRSLGRIGTVGMIDVDVQTISVNLSEDLAGFNAKPQRGVDHFGNLRGLKLTTMMYRRVNC